MNTILQLIFLANKNLYNLFYLKGYFLYHVYIGSLSSLVARNMILMHLMLYIIIYACINKSIITLNLNDSHLLLLEIILESLVVLFSFIFFSHIIVMSYNLFYFKSNYLTNYELNIISNIFFIFLIFFFLNLLNRYNFFLINTMFFDIFF